MKGKKTEEWEAKIEEFSDFTDCVRQFLDPFNKGCIRDGRIIDDFGGELFLAYRSASSASEHIKRLFDRFFREEERGIVEPLLIKAQGAYPKCVYDKLQQALHDLTLEMLYPAYEAVGRKYHSWHNDHMGTIVSEETLENGILVRKPYKGNEVFSEQKKINLDFNLSVYLGLLPVTCPWKLSPPKDSL
jgi:hypothetical protein